MVGLWAKLAEDLQSLQNQLWYTEFCHLHSPDNSENAWIVISFIFGERSNVQISYPLYVKEALQGPSNSSSASSVYMCSYLSELKSVPFLNCWVKTCSELHCQILPTLLLVLKDYHSILSRVGIADIGQVQSCNQILSSGTSRSEEIQKKRKELFDIFYVWLVKFVYWHTFTLHSIGSISIVI